MRIVSVCVAVGLALSAPVATAKPPVQISQQIITAAGQARAKGDLEEAARLYEAAIVADPASVDAYVGLGRAQAALERPKSARRYFATAVKIDPNNLSALEAQSVHYIALGDLMSAEKNINRMKRLCVNGCTELSGVLKAYDGALEETRTRVLGEGS